MEGDEQRRRRHHDLIRYPRNYGSDSRARVGSGPEIQGAGPSQGIDANKYAQAQVFSPSRPHSPNPIVTAPVNALDPGAQGYSHLQSSQYGGSQAQHASFRYQPDQQADHQRQQAYPPYGAHVMYGIPQQAPQQASFDAMTQYQPRQTAAAEVLSNQFQVPQYYGPGESSSMTTAATAASHQYPETQYQNVIQYGAAPDLRSSTLASSYSVTDPNSVQSTSTTLERPQQESARRHEPFYARYQRALRETNENTLKGRLVQAEESLREISEWLLGSVESLELTKDNQDLHQERLHLWRDFNYCWLTFLTRQLDDTSRLQTTGQRLPPGQSVLSRTSVQHLGDELIKHCDNLEKTGLVNYEMGVWEDEIIDMLIKCLDALDVDHPSDVSQSISQTSKTQS